jgi:uncharacterized protein involved in cysteine biosynthesis
MAESLSDDLTRAFRQLGDADTRGAVWWSIGLVTLGFALLVALAVWLAAAFTPTGWGWLHALMGGLAGIAGVLIAMLLFPGLVIAVATLFSDRAARRTEALHYPQLSPPRETGIMEDVLTALRFFLVAGFLNLLILPFWLIPLVGPVLSGLLNSWLVAREYFDMVAPRRLEPKEARALWRANRGRFFLAGAAVTGLLLVPVLNLAVPIIGIALFVHRLQGARAP